MEISQKRSAFGREHLRLKIVSDLDGLIAQGEKYDVIVAFHVLEHLPSVRKIFKQFNALLPEKGMLVIEVPLIEPESGKKVFRGMGIVHPLGFSKKFFEQNMPQEGFGISFENGRFICVKNAVS